MKNLKTYENYNYMNDKHFLVFYEGDGSSRESCSVLYSTLVKANTKEEAIKKLIDNSKYLSADDAEDYNAIEIDNENYIG